MKTAVCLAVALFVGVVVLGPAPYGSSSSVIYANVSVITSLNIIDFGVSHSVNVGAPLALNASLKNVGQFAVTNVILNLTITGPTPFNALYSLPSIVPGQTYNYSAQLTGATKSAGTYTANIVAQYYSSNSLLYSNPKSAQYTVTSPTPTPSGGGGGGSSGGPAPPVTSISGVGISTIPVFTSTVAGQGLTTQISVASDATVAEYVNFSIGNNFENLITLSTNSLYLLPGRSGSVSITFKTTNQTQPGTYVVPLHINVTQVNSPDPRYIEYLTFVVYSKVTGGVQVIGQTYMTNSLSTASSIIQISNNGDSTVRNATLSTFIPLAVAANSSQISASGLPFNLTASRSGYTIMWFIPYLPAGQATYAYYSIAHPAEPNLFTYSQNIFALPSYAPPQSILRVTNINAPTIYSNSTGRISVGLIYTGTTAQNVSIYLRGPTSASISNPSYTIAAVPNQFINETFGVTIGNYTGTLFFYLSAQAGGSNITESLPVLVVPHQPPGGHTTGALSSSFPVIATLLDNPFRLIAMLAVIVALLITYYAIKTGRTANRYNPERTKELIKLGNRVRRDDNE